MSRKPKVTKELLEVAYDLSIKGFNDKQIIEAIKISKSLFYINMELLDTIKRGRRELRLLVSQSLLNNAIDINNPTAQIFLAKRLNLFSEDISIDLSSPKTAIKSLECIANANISIEHKNSLKSIIGEYLKAYEVVELEERISVLEKNQDFNTCKDI